jgi:hypothetical protein
MYNTYKVILNLGILFSSLGFYLAAAWELHRGHTMDFKLDLLLGLAFYLVAD